jgi:hypothetical protein
VLAALVVLLLGAVWVGYLRMGPMESDPDAPLWDGWAMVVLWAAAAAVLFVSAGLLRRLAGAIALVVAGLAVFFL